MVTLARSVDTKENMTGSITVVDATDVSSIWIITVNLPTIAWARITTATFSHSFFGLISH